MATKSENRSLQEVSARETTFLVDSGAQAERTDLENTCKALIQSFIKMRDSRSSQVVPCQNPSEFLIHPSNTATSIPASLRGTGSSKFSTSSISDSSSQTHSLASNSSDSLGSSVDCPVDTSSLMRMADCMDVDGSHITTEDIRQLVPETLPKNLRENISQVEQGDLKELYDLKAGIQKVKDGQLSTVELIVLHWRSYQNIVHYELSDVESLRSRFLSYFGGIFADLVELCYPDRGPRRLVSCVCILREVNIQRITTLVISFRNIAWWIGLL